MNRLHTIVVATLSLALTVLSGCATESQAPSQPAGPAGSALSGKFAATAQSNWGNTASCSATMQAELIAAGGKVNGELAFAGVGTRRFEAAQQADGTFKTFYLNNRGERANVEGELSSRATVLSVWNPIDCGYRDVKLTR